MRPRGRHLLKQDIEVAQANTISAQRAADYLNVCYNTYRKYATLYGIFKTNPKACGTKKGRQNIVKHRTQEDTLKEVIAGTRFSYNPSKLKQLLIQYGYLHEECCLCGYNEQRITDHKVPLVLAFVDDNKKNYKIENLRLYCFNCAHNNTGYHYAISNGSLRKVADEQDTSDDDSEITSSTP